MRDALRLIARGEDPARAAATCAPPGCGAAAVTSTLENLRARQRGMDPPLARLLDDPAVTDVLINGTQAWVDRGGGLVRVDAGIRDEADARRAAIRLASASGVRLDDARPIADGTLPGGVRLHAVLAPVSGSGTLISLRVLGTRRLGVSDLEARGTLPREVFWHEYAKIPRHTSCAMHRIYANRINSRGMSRVFCDLRSQKTPRRILPVSSNLKI